MTMDASVEWMEAIAQHQDREAFRHLYEYFAPRVKRYLMLGNAELARADELTQEVMLTVWRCANSYDPHHSAVSTWIFAIARNRRIDSIRREHRPEPDPEDPAFMPAPPREGADEVEAQEALGELRSAMAMLPEEQAHVLRSFYTEDLSHQQIADTYHIPVGTVKSRLRYAILRLRSVITKEEDSR